MHTEIAIAGRWQGPPYFDEFTINFGEINLSFPVNLH